MSAHSKQVIDEFCRLCDWLLQTWQMRKYLFDENLNETILKAPYHQYFFYRIQVVFQESWLHQLAKLHDPAVQGGSNGHVNLSIDYIVDYGNWEPKIKSELIELRTKMTSLAKPIRDVRNKILSHNDLVVLLESKELGGFDQGEDEIYFDNLRKFVSLVRETALGEPFVYDDLVRNDVDAFMKCFLRGSRT